VKVIFPCSTLGLKEVTDSDVGLLANALGNDNLKLSFYGDKFHDVLSVRNFNCKTVQSSRASVNEDDMMCFITVPWHRSLKPRPDFVGPSATPFKLSLSSHTSKPIFPRQTKMYKLQS